MQSLRINLAAKLPQLLLIARHQSSNDFRRLDRPYVEADRQATRPQSRMHLLDVADYSRCANFMGGVPNGDAPPLTIVDYSAIDSGLGGPPFAVSVVGIDRLPNWSGLSTGDYNARRGQWREALVAIIDREFPGFASKVITCVFNTASSMSTYLNAPEGAIYGFAPLPPSGPIWKGPERSPKTAMPDLYLASSYAGSGGFTGAILAGATAADSVIARISKATERT